MVRPTTPKERKTMRKSILVVSGALFALTLTLGTGCGDKPSCKLLYKRYKKCDKMPLTEDAFLALCKKMKKKERTKAEIECSKKSDCDEFKKCIKGARKKARAARMKKRWAKAMEKAKKGNYSRAMTFCQIWKDDLDGDMKKKCKELPAKAVDALMKEIKAKRDKGEVSYKQVKCWDLKRYAKKAGPEKKKAAETLCKEIKVARNFKKAKKEVAKQMKKSRPYLPYYCSVKRVEKVKKLGSPYAKKIYKQMIDLCYKKLGKVILQKKVPKQKYICSVRSTYKAIKKYNVKGPEIDKLMEKAAEKCEKKKK
jgi:hypothetical protein